MLLLGTEIDRAAPRLDSIRDLFAGAAWHEREAAELFGGRVRRWRLGTAAVGHRVSPVAVAKDEVLAARTGLSWPGAKEPESDASEPVEGCTARRRLVPAGVPDPEIWGDRDPTAPEPQPAKVAESAAGGRTAAADMSRHRSIG